MSIVHFSIDLLCLLICMCKTFLHLSLVSLFYQPVIQIISSIFIKKKKTNTGVSLKDFWGNLIDILFTLIVLCVCGSGDGTQGFVHTKVYHWVTPPLSLYALKCNRYCSKPATISMVVQKADDVFHNKKEQRKAFIASSASSIHDSAQTSRNVLPQRSICTHKCTHKDAC